MLPKSGHLPRLSKYCMIAPSHNAGNGASSRGAARRREIWCPSAASWASASWHTGALALARGVGLSGTWCCSAASGVCHRLCQELFVSALASVLLCQHSTERTCYPERLSTVLQPAGPRDADGHADDGVAGRRRHPAPHAALPGRERAEGALHLCLNSRSVNIW